MWYLLEYSPTDLQGVKSPLIPLEEQSREELEAVRKLKE